MPIESKCSFKLLTREPVGPTVHPGEFDVVEDLRKEFSVDEGHYLPQNNRFVNSPHLRAHLCGVPMQMMLDSGSQITCMSGKVFLQLKKSHALSIFPVTKVFVSAALGRRSAPVKFQVYQDVELPGLQIPTSFLVIPGLIAPVILGNDWLLRNCVQLDFQKQVMDIDSYRVPSIDIDFGCPINAPINTTVQDDFLFVQVMETCPEGLVGRVDVPSDVVLEVPCVEADDDERAKEDAVSSVNGVVVQCPEEVVCPIEGDDLSYDLEVLDPEDQLVDEEEGDCFPHVAHLYLKDEDDRFENDVKEIVQGITTLDDEQRHRLGSMLSRHRGLFSAKAEPAGTYEHKIRLKTPGTVSRKTYPVPVKHRDAVDAEIDKMLRDGIIERSDSPYCSPLRVVMKPNGQIRLCLDARFINELIEDDHESPPLINEIIRNFHGVDFFTTTDLANGYWQIPLEEESRKYTAFLYNHNVYQFKRVPFGLKTAGSGFIRSVSLTVGNQFAGVLETYVDDMIVATRTFESHLDVVDRLFTVLEESNYTLRIDKSLFCQKEVKFLGYRLSTKGIVPLESGLQKIGDFAEPKNRKQLQSFIGVCTYYRQFVVKYANLLEPFRDLLKEKQSWSWSPEHSVAFQELKEGFSKCISIEYYDPSKTFCVQTDASLQGISGILFQTDENGDHHVISLVSRGLQKAEYNYTISELEMLAIVYSVDKFRTYLMGQHFEIITDHKALTYVNQTDFHNSRLMRWSLVLQQYDFDIRYCPGQTNVPADFFSRNPHGEFREENSEKLVIGRLCAALRMNQSSPSRTYSKELRGMLRKIASLQELDPVINPLLAKVKQGIAEDRLCIIDDVLFVQSKPDESWQVHLPAVVVEAVVDFLHLALFHPGVEKTYAYIKNFYF